MSRKVVLLLLTAGLGSWIWGIASFAAEFTIEPAAGSKITFTSRAPLESFDGHTDQVWGRVKADLADLTGEVEIQVEVDLASLDTGIGLRNRHMRENHLETDTYPRAVFRGGTLTAAQQSFLRPGKSLSVTLAGMLTLHGVTSPLTCRADLSLQPDGSLRVLTEFTVSLEAFAISRPKFLVVKLADVQEVKIDLIAQPFERKAGQS